MRNLTDSPAPPRRKRGRPVVPVRSVNLGTWLPEPEADRLIRIARRQDRSVASLIRQILIVGLKQF